MILQAAVLRIVWRGQEGYRENSWEVIAISKARDGGGANQDDNNEGDEMWLNFWIN